MVDTWKVELPTFSCNLLRWAAMAAVLSRRTTSWKLPCPVSDSPKDLGSWSSPTSMVRPKRASLDRDILFAVTEFLGIGSQVPLLLVIDAI
jgi:hypothetical protein